MAAAPIRPNSTSPGSAAPSSASITGSADIGSRLTPTRWRGAKTIAAVANGDALEPDHRRRARASQERDVGRLLAPGEGGMTRRRPRRNGERLVAKRAEILFEIGELEKQSRAAPHRACSSRRRAAHVPPRLQGRRASRPPSPPDEIALLRARRVDEAHLDAMRERGTVTSLEIATAAMRDKGLDPDTDPVDPNRFRAPGDAPTQRHVPQGQGPAFPSSHSRPTNGWKAFSM